MLIVFSIFVFSGVDARSISGRSSAFTYVSDFVFYIQRKKLFYKKSSIHYHQFRKMVVGVMKLF